MVNGNIQYYKVWYLAGPAVNSFISGGFNNDDQSVLPQAVAPHGRSVLLVTHHKDLWNKTWMCEVEGQRLIFNGRFLAPKVFARMRAMHRHSEIQSLFWYCTTCINLERLGL
jgi:hypothetical protein